MTEQQTAPAQPITPPAPAPAPSAPAVAAAPKPRRKVLPVIILVLGVAAFFIWRGYFANPTVPASIVTLSGRIEGDDSAVSPKTAGRILEIRVREGDTVKAGDVIALLDDAQIRAR
jgi:HlyD family secretion protein